jgi:hypothetical protein
MGLTPEERERWTEHFRDEVKNEHDRRIQKAPHPSALQDEAWEEARREAEIARIRTETRKKFWQDNGYVRYIDSRDAEVWLTKEEYERRTTRRRKRSRVFTPDWGGRAGRGLMLLGVIALAVILGLFLAR